MALKNQTIHQLDCFRPIETWTCAVYRYPFEIFYKPAVFSIAPVDDELVSPLVVAEQVVTVLLLLEPDELATIEGSDVFDN